MRKRQHMLFGKRIYHRESQLFVHGSFFRRIRAEILQSIIHEPHVPFEIETQPSERNRFGKFRKSRTFLRNHKRVRTLSVHDSVQLFNKLCRFKVFSAAETVREPFIPAKIMVEHTAHSIDPQTVKMEFAQPIQSVRNQEAHNLASPVIKQQRPPLRHLGAERFCGFEQCSSVKSAQSALILCEMRRNPVHYNPNAAFMRIIHKLRKLFGRTVTRRDRIIARDLITPAVIQRVFGKRQKLNMRITHSYAVIDEFASQFRVVHALFPRAGVNLVYVYRFGEKIPLRTEFKIFAVGPHIPGNAVKHACRSRSKFRTECERVGFKHRLPVPAGNCKLVSVALSCLRNTAAPTARFSEFFHRICALFPIVEIAHNGYSNRIRCKNGEFPIADASGVPLVRTQRAISICIFAVIKKIDCRFVHFSS